MAPRGRPRHPSWSAGAAAGTGVRRRGRDHPDHRHRATAAMLSVLQGMVLRPLPYPRANELALLRTHRIAQNQFEGSSIPNMQDWQSQGHAFVAMSAYRRTSVSTVVLTGTDE